MYFADYCLIGNSAVVEDIGVAAERWLAEKGWRWGAPRSSESDDFLPAPDSEIAASDIDFVKRFFLIFFFY